MSSKIATAFGEVYQDDYAKVASKWSKKLDGAGKLSNKDHSQWGLDLQKSLGDQVIAGLEDHTLKTWKKAANLPPKVVLDMYTKIAAKGALAVDTGDLLLRLNGAPAAAAPTELTIINEKGSITVPVTVKTETSEFAVDTAPELIKRASQTVSQIFDMAQDRFNGLVGKYLKKTGQASGKRQWVTSASKFGPSRHASLDGEVKAEDENFVIDGEEVYGPRPPGGSPAQWSNCSCSVVYISDNGKPLNE